jgi:hypothetical protein
MSWESAARDEVLFVYLQQCKPPLRKLFEKHTSR